jgi:UDP-N-acetylglucosamine 2-epimerase
MADSLRHFREHHSAATEHIRFITNVPVDEFIAMLKVTSCLVGNSSAGIKECSYLGTPVVDVGGRQQGRLHDEHVMHAGHEADAIALAVRHQLQHGRYASSSIYHKPDTSQTIVDLLARIDLYTQKRFCEPAVAGTRAL